MESKNRLNYLIALVSILFTIYFSIDLYNYFHPLILADFPVYAVEVKNEKPQTAHAKEQNPALNAKGEEIVVFNPNSLKYHKQYCSWAKKCKHCTKITKQQALKKGAIPCKVCSHND